MLLEVCANSVQSAVNAELGGAARIELCQNLNEGGTTPSWAAIRYCAENLKLKTFVLIRPRSGDFCYSMLDYKIIKEEVRQCKELGVAGVVVGFLNTDYTVDLERTSEIVKLASPMEVTFHRAFDICAQPEKSLEDIITCGCHRVLTSGCEKTAYEGMHFLKKIKEQAQERIQILAGSGITSRNITEIAQITGLSEFHSSCKVYRESLHYVNEKAYLDDSNITYMETATEEVQAIVKKLNALRS